MAEIEIVFPGSGGWSLEETVRASNSQPAVLLIEDRGLVSVTPSDTQVVEAPGLARQDQLLTDVANELRLSRARVLVVTRNARRLCERLLLDRLCLERFRIHCVGTGVRPFSAVISANGQLMAFRAANDKRLAEYPQGSAAPALISND